MALEDHFEHPVDPNAPKTLDLAKCLKLISASDKYARQPGGDIIREFADQLRLAVAEIGGSSTKIVNAQNEALRYQRDADAANNDVRTANTNLLAAREELRAVKEQLAAMTPKEEPATQVAPKKRGPKAKVVPMQTPAEKVAK